MITRLRRAKRLTPLPGADYVVTQGTLLSWDPGTFQNVVDIDGTQFVNVRVRSGLDQFAWKPGDVVTVEQWYPGGKKGELGIGSYCITGRILTPGTDAAEKAIAAMRSAVVKQVSAEIFAERIHVSDGWGFQAQTDEITWSDGGLGANNPTLTDIEITDAGFALVTLTGRMIIDNVHATVPGALMGAQMSMQITGATTVSPDSFGGGAFLEHRHKIAGTASGDWTSIMAASVIVPQVLNPGLHTFAARYSSAVGDNLILVDDPSIEVIAF